jgi:hypothetical protein
MVKAWGGSVLADGGQENVLHATEALHDFCCM